MPEIILENMVKRFGSKCMAANGLSLQVHDGEYLCILGPTGSGKTTCLRMICGLTTPDEGKIFFDGKEVNDMPISKRQATMLSQTYSLFPSKTVYGNVKFASEIKEWPEDESKQVVRSMINLVHMEHKINSYPNELSGGQQQRTALARAMASESKILLLDEPLRALDARLRLELRKDLKSLAKEIGLTSIHVTHDQDEALEMADRIAIIRNGSIIQIGTPQDIFQNPKTPFVANFVGRSNMFEGIFKKIDEEHSEVKLKSGTIIKTRTAELEDGSDCVVGVKIGTTRISHHNPEDLNCIHYFTGEVERLLYEGATITVEINVENIGRIFSKLPNRRYDDYKKGDIVNIHWAPENATVFAVPEKGLENELRLD